MQFLILAVFVILCLGSLLRPLWALVLALLMYPMEQSLQASVPAFVAFPPLANILTALVVGIAAVLAVFRQPHAFLGYFTNAWFIIVGIHAWSVFSLIWTPANPQAAALVTEGLPYFVLFLVAAPILIERVSDVDTFIKVLLVAGTLVALSIIINPEFNFQYGRLGLSITSKVRSSPLAMGELGGTLVIAAVLYRGSSRSVFLNLVRFAAVTIGATLALYSGSRGQILFAVLVAVVFFPISKRLKNVISFFWTVAGIVGVIGILLLVAQLVLQEDMLNRWTGNQLARGAAARELNFVELLVAFITTPKAWIVGLGFNAFTAVTNAMNEPYSHNVPLDVLCELGLPAFAAFLVLLWITYTSGRRLFAYVANTEMERASITVLLAFCVYQFLLANKQGVLWAAGPLFLHLLMVVRLERRLVLEDNEPADEEEIAPEESPEGAQVARNS